MQPVQTRTKRNVTLHNHEYIEHDKGIHMPTPKRHLNNAAKQKSYRTRNAETRNREQLAKGIPRASPISAMPSKGRWNAQIQLAHTLLDQARQEMEDYCGERSEQWQESENAIEMQERVELIEEVLEVFDNLMN